MTAVIALAIRSKFMERRFLRDEEILGADVFTPEGNLLGQINDLLIDRHTGHVRYVIIDFGDLLGAAPSGSHYPIPWSMLTFDSAADQYSLDISEAQLTNAPEYDGESFEDRDWERRTHAHYKVWPYWAY
jgi:sporulation protein YlmC with PRC-barrel domain